MCVAEIAIATCNKLGMCVVDNFGGNMNSFSAYMLVYIRNDQIDAICQPPLKVSDVPAHLVERFKKEETVCSA